MTVPHERISIDDLLVALRNVQRRSILKSLITDSPPDDVEAPEVTVKNNSEMYHIHLPRLAEYGLINWDKDKNSVTKGPHFGAAKATLQCLANIDKISSTQEGEL